MHYKLTKTKDAQHQKRAISRNFDEVQEFLNKSNKYINR